MTIAKKLGVVVLLSLAVNLFLGGMLVARWLHEPDAGQRRGHGGRSEMPLLARAGEALGDPRHPRIRELMQSHRSEIRARRRELRQARREVEAALSAPDWDEPSVRRALERLRERTTQSQAALHDALVDLARDMTPEQRSRLARPAPRSRAGARPPAGPRPRRE